MSCTMCRLHETCKRVNLMGQGKKGARIMIVQESPYETESRTGSYMGGKGGRLLKVALGEVGIDLDDVYFTSVVKCSTPTDRLPLPDEIQACQDTLFAEIDIIQPEIIVPTGNISLKVVAKLTGITKQRGKLVQKENYKVFPIIHPNMVLKQPKYMDLFSKDIINLESILNGTIPSDVISFDKERRYCETYADAVDEINRFYTLPPGSKVVVDLETIKTNCFIPKTSISERMKASFPTSDIPKIVGIGLSDRAGYGCAIPLYHRQTPFTANMLGSIVKLLRLLFQRKDLEFVAHNGKFDMRWLRAQLAIVIENFAWDTMLMHYLGVTEEKGTHGLKELAWVETDMGGYDDALDDVKPKGDLDRGNYDLIDWDILKVYLADDVDCTYRLLDKYLPIINEDKELDWLWKNLMLPGSNTLLDIECNGVFVDQEWLHKLEKNYPKEIERIYDKLHQYPEVLEIEREWRDKWEERMAISEIKKANRTEEQQQKFTIYKKFDPSKGGCDFNFGSTTQLKELLFIRLGLKTTFLTDKGEELKRIDPSKLNWTHFSTKDDSLKVMKNQHPIVETLMEFRKVNHLYNNFVVAMRGYLDNDGLIHPNYNLHGTVTGRLSSDEPNFQQMPRHCNEPILFQYWNDIKRLFTSRFGEDGVIVQYDYSQLELRILAVFSQDKNLIELYKSGVDLHRKVASDAFGIPPEEISKDQRTASKKIQLVA